MSDQDKCTLERYEELRDAQDALNSKILFFLMQSPKWKTLGNTSAKLLGFRVRNGLPDPPTEDAFEKLVEFAIYAPSATGRSQLQRFAENQVELPHDEEIVLASALASRESLFEVIERDETNSRLLLRDLLADHPDIWITDVSLTLFSEKKVLLFTRIFETPEVAFSGFGGIAYPASDKDFLIRQFSPIEKLKNKHIRERKRFALAVKLAKQSRLSALWG